MSGIDRVRKFLDTLKALGINEKEDLVLMAAVHPVTCKYYKLKLSDVREIFDLADTTEADTWESEGGSFKE